MEIALLVDEIGMEKSKDVSLYYTRDTPNNERNGPAGMLSLICFDSTDCLPAFNANHRAS